MSDYSEGQPATSSLSSTDNMASTSTPDTAPVMSDDATLPITSMKSNVGSANDKGPYIDVKSAESQKAVAAPGLSMSSSVKREGDASGKDSDISGLWLAFASLGGDSQDDYQSKSESLAGPMTTEERDVDKNETEKKDVTLKTPFVDSLGSETVAIFVGESGKEVIFHKSLLCSKADYFQKCFNGHFIEASSSKLVLDDVSVKIFSRFTDWVYKGAFSIPETDINDYIDLYLFADRILSPTFKNYIMDRLQDRFLNQGANTSTILSFSQIKRILENTLSTSNSPIRKFCAASISYFLRRGGAVERVSGIFRIEGFLKEYCAFQNEVCGAQRGREFGESTIGLGSNPYVRKYPREVEDCECCGFCCECCWDKRRKSWLQDEVGFPICFFHVHEKGEVCEAEANFYDDDSDDDWY